MKNFYNLLILQLEITEEKNYMRAIIVHINNLQA